GNIREIKELQRSLREEGFEVIDQFQDKKMDYSSIEDFRGKKRLAEKIVRNDLEFIEKCDVVVAICDKPSFGTAIEIYYAKKLGKKVIVLNKEAQQSPWPIAFADQLVKNKEELIEALLKLGS
ncbi:MAG TPA: hypothetical protein ENF63_02345, partial [Candidatus Bathyarchaeota archaeon]|nr:hypothetical protein [Candidatus Bathyarchaeota archaeon]